MLYVVGGVVVALVGAFSAFYIDAASFILSAGILLGLPKKALAVESSEDSEGIDLAQIGADIRGGLSFVRETTIIGSILVVIVGMQVAMGPLEMVFPFIVENVLDRSSSAFGVLLGAMFAGMFLSSVLIGDKKEFVDEYRQKLIPVGIFLGAVFMAGSAIVAGPNKLGYYGMAAGLAGFGAVFMLVRIPVDSLVQMHTPDDQIGKVSSILRLAARTIPPLSVAVAGPIVAAIGAINTLLAQAGLLLLVFITVLFLPVTAISLFDKGISTSQSEVN
jgi:hypothetical protein